MCAAKTNERNHLTEPTLCRTIALLRSPQSGGRFFWRMASLFSHRVVPAVSCVRGVVQPRRGMTCLRMPRPCVLLAAHAIMWFGVVAYDAMSRRGDSRLKATCLPCTSVHYNTPLPRHNAAFSPCGQPPFYCHLQQNKQPSQSLMAMPRLRGS